jgi:hypothetical protein
MHMIMAVRTAGTVPAPNHSTKIGTTATLGIEENPTSIDPDRVQSGAGARFLAVTQKQYPKVLFDLRVMDHDRALTALAAYEVDLALVYRPAMWRIAAGDREHSAAAGRHCSFRSSAGREKDRSALGMRRIPGRTARPNAVWPADP